MVSDENYLLPEVSGSLFAHGGLEKTGEEWGPYIESGLQIQFLLLGVSLAGGINNGTYVAVRVGANFEDINNWF